MYNRIKTFVDSNNNYGVQTTLASQINITGIGLHTGKSCEVIISPSGSDTGIFFQKRGFDGIEIKALAENVGNTSLSTNLFYLDKPFVRTIEHVVSALYGCGIYNANIFCSSSEIPILDGSAIGFVDELIKVGVKELTVPQQYLVPRKEIVVLEGDAWASIAPAKTGFNIEAEIGYDHPLLAKQKLDFQVTPSKYIEQIASARTFCFEYDIKIMREKNLALGGSLDNAIVFSKTDVINPRGLRFPDECVRHKVLDIIGDIALLGYPVIGKIKCYKSGHKINNKLCRALLADDKSWELVSFN